VSDDLSIPNPGYRGSRAGRYGTGPNRVRQGMDPDTRRLVIFAGGLGAVLAVLVGASALMGRHSGETPIVVADPRPIREKPVNPGGMKIDGAENDVFSGGTDTSNAKLAPAPEAPDTKALQNAAAAPPPAAQMPALSALTPPPPPAPPAPVTRPAVVASEPPAARSMPVPAPAKPASVVAEAHPPAPVHPPVATADTHPATATHEPSVQLAALTSEGAAHAEWADLEKKMPDLLKGRQPSFVRTERGGLVFWRVRTSGFADVAQARSFCDRVRAKGGGCSIADF
jgi:hypothetical protein